MATIPAKNSQFSLGKPSKPGDTYHNGQLYPKIETLNDFLYFETVRSVGILTDGKKPILLGFCGTRPARFAAPRDPAV